MNEERRMDEASEAVSPAEEQLITLLTQLLPAPETSLAKARVRARVMAAARDQLEPQPSPLFRPLGLAAAAASAVVALGSGGAIGASANALPGEALYSLKLAVEEVQSAITAAKADPVAVVAIEEERATKRVAEIEALAAQNRPIPAGLANAVAHRVAAAATAAAQVPEGRRVEAEDKRESAQAQREETLTRVLAQVPPPAQTAISNALERHDNRTEQRQGEKRQDQEEKRAERDDRREERVEDRGPGSSGNSGSNNAGGRAAAGAPVVTPQPTSTPLPTATPRATEPARGRQAEPQRSPEPPRARVSQPQRQDDGRPGNSGSNGSGNSSGSGNGRSSRAG